MGFFNSIILRKSADPAPQDGHTLPTPESLIQPTHEGAFNPRNPGNLKPIRSVPIMTEARPVTGHERGQMEAFLERRKVQSEDFQATVKALQEAERLDTRDHKAYMAYRETVAETELEKLQINAEYVQKLHQLRPGYQQIVGDATKTQAIVETRLTSLMGRIQGLLNGGRNING